ncbi:FAD-dependent pyridine nucleotide-disulfide oxidoreductase [Natrialba hulunbeirensis JCM 10989]|uniref:FAD-dependent pyridine nucleotide-disulfide oxidoreductase n=1 Tax=Natrialba hulunbeirensis JCM 10989 TaxID=1227493 RepID=M0A8E3_9EURY|nr:FAD-dependent oxidoreductase [Natrialba hulunbeirensis]ELY94636.1 FAD-dependent pyridine nucleotide-disulfide oxidoreductase [Natrialba hulunbeirensis JCM 10989]
MSDVIIVGGGPAGLSAALFTAKNGLETAVFDTDDTWMHKAHLFNYLGVRSLGGDEYMMIARGQVEDRGADLHLGESVTAVESAADGFRVETEDNSYEATYVVLATGADRSLAEDTELDIAFDDEGAIDVDIDMETSVENLYATGAMVRAEEWQAVIAAGDGASAALNILSKEKGEHFHDFDTPADVPALRSE